MRQTYRGVLSNPSLVVSSTEEVLATPTAVAAADLNPNGAGVKRAADEASKAAEGADGQAPKGKKRKGGQAPN